MKVWILIVKGADNYPLFHRVIQDKGDDLALTNTAIRQCNSFDSSMGKTRGQAFEEHILDAEEGNILIDLSYDGKVEYRITLKPTEVIK